MTIVINKRKNETVISVKGVLDDVTMQALENTINDRVKVNASIVVDLSGVEKISSAGLQTLLNIGQKMDNFGSLRLTGVSKSAVHVYQASNG